MTPDNSFDRSPAVLLALEFYRYPMALRDWLARSPGLPQGIGELIRLAGAKEDSLQRIAACYQIDKQELGDAARFFLQQVLLAPGTDHYRVLGVEQKADSALIRTQYRLLMRLFHPDRHPGQECWTDAYATRVNQAYNVLRCPESRLRYEQAQSQAVLAAGAPVSEEEAVSAPRAFVRGGVNWPDHEQLAAGAVPDNGRGRTRTILFAVLILLLVVAVPGWLVRSNQTAVMSSSYVGLSNTSPAAQQADLGVGAFPPQRGNGIPPPRLATLGLVGARSAEVVSPSARSIDPAEVDTAAQMQLLTAIPPSRDVAMSGIGRDRPALVIPPPRTVDVPAPHGTPKPPEGGAKVPLETSGDKLATSEPPSSGSNGPDASALARGRGVPALAEKGVTVSAETSIHPLRERQSKMLSVLPQPAVALKSLETPISEVALMSLLGHLVSSYQRGDLSGFISLFSDHASTTDEASLGEIEQEYRHLFSTTKARRLQVSGLSWQLYANAAQGEGYMVIQIRRADRGLDRYAGRFTVHITREQRQLRISGLFYDLERG